MMSSRFAKGILIGGIIGASVSMMMPEVMDNKSRRKIMKTGRYLLRRSGNIIGDVVDIFR